MKNFSTRTNITRLAVPVLGTLALIALMTLNGCTDSENTTGKSEDAAAKNAREAEAAEAHIAEKKHEPASEKKQESAAKAKKVAAHEASRGEKHETSKRVRRPAAAGGTYVVQVGAFKVKENAEKLQEKLHQAGYPVEMQTVDHSKNGTLHLVRFQPTGNRAEAETFLEDLSAKQKLHAQILTTQGSAR